MIIFPLQVDEDGDLLTSNDPVDIVTSEAHALLDTELYSRPLRIDYGSKTYVLKTLELGQLLTDLETKLKASLNFGTSSYTDFEISSTSTLSDIQAGILNILIVFKYNSLLQAAALGIEFNELR
jgi:hypothetical protein